MERPSVGRSLLGLALLGVGVSGYVGPLFTQWTTPKAVKTVVARADTPAPAFKTYHDKHVSLGLPSGWRWLAQKPDGSEAGASYFALSRFQGQNALNEPVGLRVDALNNADNLDAAALLAGLAKNAVSGSDAAVRPIASLPAGTAGVSFPSTAMGRPVLNFMYVKPGKTLSYVLSVGSFDQRFTEALANKIFASMQIKS
ncbi:MAG: hypothetical protein H7338_00945 [Candidatus Sericytochromatia bacterium]|nr:hypothetical protein [Candidatus Sericytochromatia bacterium]